MHRAKAPAHFERCAQTRARIVLSAMLPRCSATPARPGWNDYESWRGAVDDFNRRLSQWADGRVAFVDCAADWRSEHEARRVLVGGVHLGRTGYAAWTACVADAVERVGAARHRRQRQTREPSWRGEQLHATATAVRVTHV